MPVFVLFLLDVSSEYEPGLWQEFIRQPGIPVETALRVYRRYLKLEPTHTEEFIAYLKSQVNLAECTMCTSPVMNHKGAVLDLQSNLNVIVECSNAANIEAPRCQCCGAYAFSLHVEPSYCIILLVLFCSLLGMVSCPPSTVVSKRLCTVAPDGVGEHLFINSNVLNSNAMPQKRAASSLELTYFLPIVKEVVRSTQPSVADV